MKAVIVFSAIVACAFALGRGSSCKVNSDCAGTQCCVSNDRWMIASKRDVISMSGFDMNGGTCVNYIKQGASCHAMGFTSCGCEPSTKCIYHPEPLPTLPALKKVANEKRDMFWRPGNSLCEPKA